MLIMSAAVRAERTEETDMTQTATRKQIKARSITELCGKLSDEWYDSVEGDYYGVQSWGPQTDTVDEQISRSCAEGDIVSWDTRPTDVNKHRYLVRRWNPSRARTSDNPDGNEQVFFVVTHAQLVASDTVLWLAR
jgi:hypothetical protein